MRALLGIDPILLSAALFLTIAGLAVLVPVGQESADLFSRQLLWAGLGIGVGSAAAHISIPWLERREVVLSLYGAVLMLLLFTLVSGAIFQGAKSWIDLGFVVVQPVELAKLALVVVLAKYFARRHVAIRQWRHVVASALYTSGLIVPVLLQPDLGSAVVLGALWLTLVVASGIPFRSLAVVTVVGALIAVVAWSTILSPYQRDRVLAFLSPTADPLGTGYSARQARIAIGAGGLLGQGVGFGTQTRYGFLPEYETDFFFAAFAEEWGFVGVVALVGALAVLLLRLTRLMQHAPTPFAQLLVVGVWGIIAVPAFLHLGINLGLLPVTGLAFPFASYGGSHSLVEWVALGVASRAARG